MILEQEPTLENAKALQAAYNLFNRELFESMLPGAMILVHRKRGAHGYFWAEQFRMRPDEETAEGAEPERIDEIALNPETMGRTEQEVLSTLLHEMCHQWQKHWGENDPKNNYHDREFADIMEKVGLVTSKTGKPGGARTGREMTHYIAEDGPFPEIFHTWETYGLSLKYFTEAQHKATGNSRRKKIGYTCPECEAKAWGKPGLALLCGHCYSENDDIIEMVE